MEKFDLNSDNVTGLFSKIFLPTLIGMLSISAVTAIDGIFIGQGVGSDGIAAVNILIPVYMIFTGVALMVGAGCSVAASILLSRGKVLSARVNVTQAMILVTVVSAVAELLMLLFPERTALLLGSSPTLMSLVVDYIVSFVPSWIFQMWITVGLFVIRLDGAPRLAMLCSVLAAVENAFLDWLFIFPLDMGLFGAGVATSISLATGGLIVGGYIAFKARTLRLCRLPWTARGMRQAFRNLALQCRVGSSSLLNEATLAVLMFVGNQVFMHYLGDDGVGAFGIACYYAPFVFMVGNAIAQSAQPVISYNYGAGEMGRVAKVTWVALRVAVLCGLLVTVMFVVFPEFLVSLFVSPEGRAARIAIGGFPLFSVGFTAFILNLTVVGYYQSVERVKPATVFALMRGCLFMVPFFLLLPLVMGEAGIWLAMPFSEICTVLSVAIFYLRGRRISA